jgi:hypothetical protein
VAVLTTFSAVVAAAREHRSAPGAAMISSVDPPFESASLIAELASLPPKPPRSKLEPHRELIRELRRKGRTYREVSRLFADRLGLQVAPSTLHSFVKVRARHRKQVQFELPTVEQPSTQPPERDRLAAFKVKPTVQESKRSRFVFRENEPLTLSTDGGTR